MPVNASAQLTTEISGTVAFQAGIYDNDNPGELGRAFRSDIDLRVRMLGEMENGILYGSEIQLQTPDKTRSSVQLDEAYLFFSSTWGRIELGDEDGAMPKMAIYAPAIGLGQLDGDYDQFTLESIQDIAPPFYAAASEKATKITYYTPRFLGFQMGASYAPEADLGNNSAPQSTVESDYIEGGINYLTEINDIGLAGGATVVRSRDRNSSATESTPLGYQVGGQISNAGVTVGGGYTNYDGARGIADGFNIGISFQEESYAVGAQYARMQTEAGRNLDGLGFGASYILAPGLLLGADFVHYKSELPTREVHGHVLLLASRMTF